MENPEVNEAAAADTESVPEKARRAGFWRGLLGVLGAETRLIRSHPRFGLALVAVAFFPALYLVIYLGGVWDPASHTDALEVGIVDLDRGTAFHGRFANVGTDVTRNLLSDGAFHYSVLETEAEARAAVAHGKMVFALVIPADFSADAVPGRTEGAGHIRILFSEGNNSSQAVIVRRFASELGRKVNVSLNETRWQFVLRASGKSVTDLEKLRDGIDRLATGAAELDDGMTAYREAAKTVANGFAATADAVRTMRDKLPVDDKLTEFADGARKLAAGQRSLEHGLAKLGAGSGKLSNGLDEMGDRTRTIPIVGTRIAKGADALGNGADKLRAGLRDVHRGARRLVTGAEALSDGATRLVDGMTKLGGGVRVLASKMPEDGKLVEFADSADRLADGARRLHEGVDLVRAALPDTVETLDGDAAGLASSVEPELENLAPVANNGMAFAPSMLSVAAWVGAVVLANMFSLRMIREDTANAPRIAKVAGKLALPLAVVTVQAALLSLVTQRWLAITPVDPAGFWISTLVVSASFMAAIFALLRLTGDAGKLVAVLLLTLQLTAGGGILPIELTAPFYRSVHDWLPFTFAVEAYRASLFGALAGDWQTPVEVLGAMLAGSFVVAMFIGRWRVVSEEAFKPGLDL